MVGSHFWEYLILLPKGVLRAGLVEKYQCGVIERLCGQAENPLGLGWVPELALLASWAVELAATGSESLGEEATWFPRQEVSLCGMISHSSVGQQGAQRESNPERLALFKCAPCPPPCSSRWPCGTRHHWFLESIYGGSEAWPSLMHDSASQGDRLTHGGCKVQSQPWGGLHTWHGGLSKWVVICWLAPLSFL